MKNAYTRAVSTPTPQTEQADERQIKNNAGGFVYQVSDQTRLERFLVLGTPGGTYYQSEKDITKQNVDWLVKLIKNETTINKSVLQTITEISESGRAYKNSPAIFALALVFKHANVDVKPAAKRAVLKVCRTATHLFELAEYFEALGGWSRAKRSAVADWYNTRTPDQVAFQAVKYRQRNGWTHRDLFRLAHPKGVDKNVGNFILGKLDEVEVPQGNPIYGFLNAQSVKPTDTRSLLAILDKHPNLPWEALPTQSHKDPEIWKRLFYNGQLKGQALVRNITRLARIGAFNDMVFAKDYADRLADSEQIKASRLHPLNFLNAIVVHQDGQTNRKLGYGKNKDWATVPVIVDALNSGFYQAFDFVEPAGKRFMLAVDVSGSMGSQVLGLELTCAQVSGAMAMAIARTEPYYMVRGFTSGSSGYGRYGYSSKNELTDLGITPGMDLNTVMHNVQKNNFGRTDCSLPMEWAIENKVEIDAFVVLTDNETYAGKRHPDEALRDYRRKMGIDAKLIVVGMTATECSIANPNDAGMLDVVGADANLPRLIADFSAGRL